MRKFVHYLASALLLICPFIQTGKADDHAETLKVMTLNVWNQGRYIENGFEKIVDVIIKADADIVTISEVRNYNNEDWMVKLAEAIAKKEPSLVYHTEFAGGDVGILSRYPLESSASVFDAVPKEDSGSLIAWRMTLHNGAKATVCAAHLDYKYFGLNLIRGYNGGVPDFNMIDKNKDEEPDRVSDVQEILEYDRKSRRGEAIDAFVKFAEQEQADNRLVILAGDFNEGSHLDWTAKAKKLYGHYGVVIDWYCSSKLYESGFRDAYRTLLPDEVKNPGFTWPAIADGKKTTSWAPKSEERDRIDFIYYPADSKTRLKPVKTWMVGPKAQFINETVVPYPGKEPFACDDMPWPTDHNGVMVEFSL